MAMIYVRAREGRRAYYEGKVIPEDKFVPVTDTPYVRRLVQRWGDLEVEGGEEALKPQPRRQGVQPQPPRPKSPVE